MARLPSDRFLVQQIGNDVVLFEDGTERELARAKVYNGGALALALGAVQIAGELSTEDLCFAHFWFGYFYGCAASARDVVTAFKIGESGT